MKDRNLFISSVIFFLLYIIFVLVIFSSLKTVFMPIIITFAVVYMLSPLVNFFIRLKFKPIYATTIVFILIAGGISVIIFYLLPSAKDAVHEIFKMLETFIKPIEREKYEIISKGAQTAYKTAMEVIKTGAMVLVGIIAGFYTLCGKKEMTEQIKEFVPTGLVPSFKVLLDDIKLSFDSFFKGQVVIALILFVIDFVFLCFLDLPYAFGLSVIAACLDIIPYAGAFIGIGLIVITTLMMAPDKLLVTIIGLLIIQQIENNIISPKISANTLKLHPAVTVIVLYIGAYGGFWGILLSIPLASVFCRISKRLIQSII